MRKAIAILMTFIMVLGMIPLAAIPVFAASTITFIVEAQDGNGVPITEANVGDEITFVIKASSAAGTNLNALTLDIVIPSGLTYSTGSNNLLTTAAALNLTTLDFDESPDLKIVGYGDTGFNDLIGNLAEFKCIADSSGIKNVTLTATTLTGAIATPPYYEDITASVTPATVTITGTDISNAVIAFDRTPATYEYTGLAIEPTMTVTLVDTATVTDLVLGTDYDVDYTVDGNPTNTAVGTATVTITGKGIYSGSATAEFEITDKTIITVTGVTAKDKDYVANDTSATLEFLGANIHVAATPTDIDITVATLTDITVWEPIVVIPGVGSSTDITITNITGTFANAGPGANIPVDLVADLNDETNYTVVFESITATINSVVPALSAPRNLKATPASGQVTLTWTAPEFDGGSEIREYNVYVSVGTATDIFTTTSTRYTVTGLTNGTQYTFSVRAVNIKDEEGPAASVTAIPAGGGVYPVNPPGGGTGTGGGGGGTTTTTEPDAPKPDPILVDIDGMTFEATIDASGNLVITLSEEDVEKYKLETGVFTITVKGYEKIILSIITEALEDDDLVIITDFGTLTIPNATVKEMQKLFGDEPLRLLITKGSFNVALINSKGKEITYDNPDYPFMITLPYTLKPGEKSEAVIAVRKVEKRNIIIPFAVYREETTDISFNVTRTGGYDAIYRQKDYKDVPGHWGEKYIDFITARGLEDYSTDGKDMFSPEQRLTRATVANMLATIEEVNLSKYNTTGFSDVPMGEWYSKAVAWAADVGIVNGYEDGTFKPKQLVTREEIAVMLDRYIKYKGWDINEVNEKLSFEDNAKISSWAAESIDSIQQAGIINGKPGNMYDPKGITTRAEYVTIFARLIEAYSK